MEKRLPCRNCSYQNQGPKYSENRANIYWLQFSPHSLSSCLRLPCAKSKPKESGRWSMKVRLLCSERDQNKREWSWGTTWKIKGITSKGLWRTYNSLWLLWGQTQNFIQSVIHFGPSSCMCWMLPNDIHLSSQLLCHFSILRKWGKGTSLVYQIEKCITYLKGSL